MLAKRIIPCLDVHDGQVTRGVQFGRAEAGELRNVGDPVELALRYNEQGADEMVFFDITASAHGRKTMIDVIERVAEKCFMPLTVGGGQWRRRQTGAHGGSVVGRQGRRGTGGQHFSFWRIHRSGRETISGKERDSSSYLNAITWP